MGGQYKLRLGDGTVLTTDQQGLRAWAIDRKAMVQSPDSGRWLPLKQALEEGLPAPPAPPAPPAVPAPAASKPAASARTAEAAWGMPVPEGSLRDIARAEMDRHPGREDAFPWRPAADGAAPPPPAGMDHDMLQELALDTEAAIPPPVVVTASSVRRPGAGPTPVPATAAAPPRLPAFVEAGLAWIASGFEALGREGRRLLAPAPPAGAEREEAAPPARDKEQPPPALKDLAVLRLAAEEGTAPAAAARPKAAGRARSRELRVFAAIGLAAALAVLAFATRSRWAPRDGGASPARTMAYLPPRPAAEPEPPPLPEPVRRAVEQLPHLSLETIQLVMERVERGQPDPAEVFRRAHAAAHRGRPTLSAEEEEELRALQQGLLSALARGDRDRVRAYDRMSPVRDLLVAEDEKVRALVARGARALPAPRRQRLQALLGKAVAAGLGPGPARG